MSVLCQGIFMEFLYHAGEGFRMRIYADNTRVEPLGEGYRLIRRERSPGQEVSVIGPIYNEFGFELFAFQDKTRGLLRRLKSEGRHTVMAGFMNRHVLYEEADEYWGFVPYCGGERSRPPGTAELRAAFGEYREEDSSYVTSFDHMLIVKGSSEAAKKAAELASGGKTVTILPRFRDHPNRNFGHWGALASALVGYGAKVVSCCTKNFSAPVGGVTWLEDEVGPENLLDVEVELHKVAACTLASDSGCQCVPILAGAKRLVIFCGMYQKHRELYDAMSKAFPGYCGLHVLDSTGSVTNATSGSNNGEVTSAGVATAEVIAKYVKDRWL